MFRRLSIAARIWLAIVLLLLGLLALLSFTTLLTNRVNAEFAAATEAQLERRDMALRWAALVELNVDRTAASYVSADQAVDQVLGARFLSDQKIINELQDKLDKSNLDEQSRVMIRDIAQARQAVIAVAAKIAEVKKSGDLAATRQMVKDALSSATVAYVGKLQAFAQRQTDVIAEIAKVRDEKRATNNTLTRLMLVALCALLALGAWALIRSLRSTLREAIEVAEAIEQGDLSRSLQVQVGGDEVAQMLTTLGRMRQGLVDLISEVRSRADHMQQTSIEIASGNQDLSQRTEMAAANLQDSATSLDGLTQSVQSNAQSARHASELAARASDVARRGGEAVSEVVARMNGINDASRKIADIISVIDGIAFQTNILALNAAVEAARAGEQGRGFAVVASEVRSLAGRSAEAAKEIKTLIDASVQQVEAGSAIVSNAGQTMDEIVAAVQQVTGVIAEISAATGSQSSGIAGVNQSIGNLDRVTQQNTALVEEAAAAASSLKDDAQQLATVVSRFRLP